MSKFDSIVLTCIEAEKNGRSYGKQVALCGVVRERDEEEIIPPVRDRTCSECGRPFHPTTGKMKFCSKECCEKNAKRRYLQRKQEKLKSIDRTCVVCGKPIPESRALNAKTCSEECAEKLHLMNKNLRNRDKRDKKRTCPICGERFIPAVHNQKYCSKECSAGANREKARSYGLRGRKALEQTLNPDDE